MRKLFALAWNDIRNEFSEHRSIVFFLLLPILFTWIIGLAMQSMFEPAGESEDTRTPLVVVNEDQGSFAADLISFLDQSEMVRVEEKESAEAWQLFEDESIPSILVIPVDFSAKVMNQQQPELAFTFNPTFSSSTLVQQAVSEALEPVNRAVAIGQQAAGFSTDSVKGFSQEAYQNALESFRDPQLLTSVEYPAEAQADLHYTSSFQLSSPGQLITWVLVSLSGSSVLFVVERQNGTLRRLLTSPTRRATILGGKILGRVGMGVVQMLLLILFGKFFLGINWGNSPLALLMMVISFAFTGTALGMLLGAVAKTTSQASGLSTICSMLLAALGGAWWPLEITPRLYQQVVQVLPSTWAMQGFNRIILSGQGVSAVLIPCAILWGFTLVFFIIGIRKLQFE
jgi:ABC-2 type transport system permease protein